MGFFEHFNNKNRMNMITGAYFLPKEIENIIADPVTEGKKRGYQQAAKEFETVYSELKDEYNCAKMLFKAEFEKKDNQLNEYIKVLEALENEKYRLETEVKAKKESLDITAANGALYIDFFSILKNNNKFDKAKIDGYNEAKELYHRKLSSLKGQLTKLQTAANKTINEHQRLIMTTLSEISLLKTAIAEMKLVK